jgi:hypothetical protein
VPYIRQEEREEFRQLDDLYIDTPGKLVYCFTRLIRKFIRTQPIRFITYALVLGCLCATALEFYRRGVAPYEDEQLRKNGDVG